MQTIPDPAHEIPIVDRVDILIVGGGMTGVAAALSAARMGAKVLIIEQFNCLGGVATAGWHNHLSQFNTWASDQRVVGGIAHELSARLIEEGFATTDGSCVDFNVEGLKLVLDQMMAEAGVKVLYYTFFCDTLVENGAVIGGIIQNKSGRQAVLAYQVIDTTGDADVAAYAGAPFKKGRPEDGLCQPTTLMFMLEGVDWPRVAAWRTNYQMEEAWLKAQADGIMEPFQNQIMGWWHTDVLPSQVGVNMTHMTHIDATITADLTKATIEGRRQAHHLTEVFRQVVPGMENCYLISTAAALGLRESRRIEGEVTLTEQDMISRREWEDAIGYGSFYIDIHNPAGPGMSDQTYRPEPGFHYQIPYRVMVPQGVDNLLVAGRCVSVTHIALGSIRIMLTCMVMGEAAGAAAVLSLHEEVPPRELNPQILKQQLQRQGAIVEEEHIINGLPGWIPPEKSQSKV
ncbi:MAG: FAD-dependent oxidoreductase [Anaerolineae bacterium]|nr:FAD-dependent oxidoreductase [Anaerolineae bacterium]